MAGKPLAKDERNNYFFVDSRRLIVDDLFNEREDYGDIESLVKWIEANGLRRLPPLRGYKKGEQYVIIRGHRRNEAIKRIAEKTGAVQMVPIILAAKGESLERRYFEQATENEGKAFTPWEKAKVCKKMRSYGWSAEQMALESGWSITYVKRLLLLADAPQKLIDLVRNGKVKATFAIDTVQAGTTDELIARAEKGEIVSEPVAPELFETPPGKPKKKKITKSDLKKNSVGYFNKWSKKIDENTIPAKKRPIYEFVIGLVQGKYSREDIEEFFK